MRHAIRIGPEFRIVDDRAQSGDRAELAPEIVVGDPDHDRAIGRLEGLIGTERFMARTAFRRLHAALPEGLEIVAEQAQCGFEQRDLDLAALPGFFPRIQQRQNAAEGMHAGHLVDRRNRTADIAAILVAGHRHDPAKSLQDHVIARRVLQRPRAAEPGDAAMDQAVVQGAKRRRIDAKALGDPGPETFDGDVGGFCQRMNDLASLFRSSCRRRCCACCGWH